MNKCGYSWYDRNIHDYLPIPSLQSMEGDNATLIFNNLKIQGVNSHCFPLSTPMLSYFKRQTGGQSVKFFAYVYFHPYSITHKYVHSLLYYINSTELKICRQATSTWMALHFIDHSITYSTILKDKGMEHYITKNIVTFEHILLY